jgi:hypothetical protein
LPTRYGDSQSNVSDEAGALAAIVRDTGAFPPGDRHRVRGAVGAYVRAVVDDEWRRMHDGNDSRRASAAVDGMYTAIQGLNPRSPRAVSFYDDAVEQLTSALEARRNRLDDADGGLPWVIGVLLLVGSVVIVGYTILVASRSYWFHAIGAGAVALILALALVVLLDLSYPFSGDLSVDSAPFRIGALEQFFASSR